LKWNKLQFHIKMEIRTETKLSILRMIQLILISFLTLHLAMDVLEHMLHPNGNLTLNSDSNMILYLFSCIGVIFMISLTLTTIFLGFISCFTGRISHVIHFTGCNIILSSLFLTKYKLQGINPVLVMINIGIIILSFVMFDVLMKKDEKSKSKNRINHGSNSYQPWSHRPPPHVW